MDQFFVSYSKIWKSHVKVRDIRLISEMKEKVFSSCVYELSIPVGGEAQAVDDVTVLKSVQMLAIIQVPEHGLN